MEKKFETQNKQWSDYLHLRASHTKPYLMISELIDNSIGSMEDHYKRIGKPWEDEVLKIYIDAHFKTKSKSVKDWATIADSYIRVTDNAYGMDPERVEASLRINEINKNTKSKMNVHGRGMKQSAFYFGMNLNVKSSQGKGVIGYGSILAEGKKWDQVFEYSHWFENEEMDRGTIVEISSIYNTRQITQNGFKDLVNVLSFRFARYLKRGILEIYYTNDVSTDGTKIEDFIRHENPIEPITKVKTEFGKSSLKEMQRVIQNSISEIDRYKNQEPSEDDKKDDFGMHLFSEAKYQYIIDDTVNRLENLLIQSIDNEEMDFVWRQVLKINDRPLHVKFWGLKRRNAPFRGYRVYEGDRALLHPKIDKKDPDSPQTYHQNVMAEKSRNTENIFAGEFEISELGIKTTTDKSQFELDRDVKLELDSSLRLVWEIFNIFIGNSRKKDKDKQELTSEQYDAIIRNVNSRFNKSTKEVKAIEDENMIQLKIRMKNDAWWTLNLEIDDTTNFPVKIWERNVDEEEKIINMTAYQLHELWQSITQSKNFLSQLLVPISLLMCHFEVSNILDGKTSLTDQKILDVLSEDWDDFFGEDIE